MPIYSLKTWQKTLKSMRYPEIIQHIVSAVNILKRALQKDLESSVKRAHLI